MRKLILTLGLLPLLTIGLAAQQFDLIRGDRRLRQELQSASLLIPSVGNASFTPMD